MPDIVSPEPILDERMDQWARQQARADDHNLAILFPDALGNFRKLEEIIPRFAWYFLDGRRGAGRIHQFRGRQTPTRPTH